MSDFEHVMISRAELAEILMKAKGFNPDEVELVNMDFQSSSRRQVLPIYEGEWTNEECPFDIITFGVKKKDDPDPISTQSGSDESTV